MKVTTSHVRKGMDQCAHEHGPPQDSYNLFGSGEYSRMANYAQ